MKIPTNIWLSILVLIGLAGVWRFWPRKDVPGKLQLLAPKLELSWTGEFRGAASLPIDFTWCPGQRLGMLEGISASGDTGILVLFHERDSLTPVTHMVLSPEMTGAAAPPWANAGLRLGRDSSVAGYVSMSGKMELTGTTAQQIGGAFTMTLRRPGKSDTLVVTGKFPATPVIGRSAGCN